MASSPTLIFVPGSWHKGLCYSKITKLLSDDHNLKCVTIDLPSNQDDPSANFKDDIDTVRSAITSETTQGHNVIVLAHSYGGMVGNSALKSLTSPTSLSHGSVIGLILIASGFTLTGLAFMDPFFGHPPPYWRVNKETGYAEIVSDPRWLFYHDVAADEVEYWVSQLTTQSLKALFEGGEYAYAGWRDVPAWYIGTSEDHGLPVAVQRLGVGAARAMGGRVVHRELPASHSPFLSMPEETVGIVLEAVEAFTGGNGREQGLVERDTRRVTVPAVSLFQLGTWFRFGLPYLFGNLVGKGILAFEWVRRVLRSR